MNPPSQNRRNHKNTKTTPSKPRPRQPFLRSLSIRAFADQRHLVRRVSRLHRRRGVGARAEVDHPGGAEEQRPSAVRVHAEPEMQTVGQERGVQNQLKASNARKRGRAVVYQGPFLTPTQGLGCKTRDVPCGQGLKQETWELRFWVGFMLSLLSWSRRE